MIDLLFIKPVILFIFNSPQEWVSVVAVGFLLFGANRLPDLAKSLGKARNEFKKGIFEAENETEDEKDRQRENNLKLKPAFSEIDDEALLEEIRRRQETSKEPKQLN